MQPITHAPISNALAPVEHPKKRIIVALLVASGVAAAVSLVALAVLIPPVGAALTAALIAAAIKVSIGAGAGSVLTGGAAYLIYKLNKPVLAPVPLVGKPAEEPKPVVDDKPNIEVNRQDINAGSQVSQEGEQARIMETPLPRVLQVEEQSHVNQGAGKVLKYNENVLGINLRGKIERLNHQKHQGADDPITERKQARMMATPLPRELQVEVQSHVNQGAGKVLRYNENVLGIDLPGKIERLNHQKHQGADDPITEGKQARIMATPLPRMLQVEVQSHVNQGAGKVLRYNENVLGIDLPGKIERLNHQKHQGADDPIAEGKQARIEATPLPQMLQVEIQSNVKPSKSVLVEPRSPIQVSRTPSPELEGEMDRLNKLVTTTIENEAMKLNQSIVAPPPHIGRDLMEQVPAPLLTKIIAFDNFEEIDIIVDAPKQQGQEQFENKNFEFNGPVDLRGYVASANMDDNVNIAFVGGKIVSLEQVNGAAVNPRSDCFAILKANFRDEVVEEVAKTFRFEKPNEFTFSDYKRIIVTVLASLYDKDVQLVFDSVKGKRQDKGCVNLLTDEEKDYLKRFDAFEEVDQKGRQMILTAYYRLLNFDPEKVKETSAEMLADLEIVRAFHSTLPQLRREEQEKLSRAEYLAKVLAYLELRVGQIVKVPKNAHEEDLYIVTEHLGHDDHKDETQAVICRVLVPYQKNKSDAIVLARGTQTGSQVGALNSLIRDADWEGVGKGSFDRASPGIFAMIQRTMDNLGPDAKLEIQGHSLAGVDAQRILKLVVKKISEGFLKNIREIVHFSHNPPGTSKAEEMEYQSYLAKLDPNLHVERNFITFSGDLISWFGSIYLGAESPDSRNTGTFYVANTTRFLLAAHTCVSTKKDLELAKPGEKIEGNKVAYEIHDLNSKTGRTYLLKKYASWYAGLWAWERYFVKHVWHRAAFIFVVRAFGRVERKLEDRVNLA